jgi:hypothetical protein
VSITPAVGQDLQRGIRNYLEIVNGRKTVDELSSVERQEVLLVIQGLQRQQSRRAGTSRPSYEIEVLHNDELFVINGEKFEAKTYCFNMDEGDQVIFLEGSALGACVSAKLLNLRSREVCEVWCE